MPKKIEEGKGKQMCPSHVARENLKKYLKDKRLKQFKKTATIQSLLVFLSNFIFLIPLFIPNFSFSFGFVISMFLLLVLKILYVDYEFCIKAAEELRKLIGGYRIGNFILNRDIDEIEEVKKIINDKKETVILCLPLGIRIFEKGGKTRFIPYFRFEPEILNRTD